MSRPAEYDSWPCMVVTGNVFEIIGTALLRDGRYDLVRQVPAAERAASARGVPHAVQPTDLLCATCGKPVAPGQLYSVGPPVVHAGCPPPQVRGGRT